MHLKLIESNKLVHIFLHGRHGFNLTVPWQINREIKYNEDDDRKRIHLHTN